MPQPTRKAIVKWTVTALMIAVVAYPLSYAPAVHTKIVDANDTADAQFLQRISNDDTGMGIYRPVDWLIDNTPLDASLIGWASLWGVKDEFENAKSCRDHPPFFTF